MSLQSIVRVSVPQKTAIYDMSPKSLLNNQNLTTKIAVGFVAMVLFGTLLYSTYCFYKSLKNRSISPNPKIDPHLAIQPLSQQPSSQPPPVPSTANENEMAMNNLLDDFETLVEELKATNS